MSMRIFQYGSNMSRQQIERRLGPVTDHGPAELPEYELAFQVHSEKRDCAVADMQEHAGHVLGRVYDITGDQGRILDMFEGVPLGVYRRQQVFVPGFGDALTWVGTDASRQKFADYYMDELPSREYLGLLIEGLEDPAMRAPLPYISHVIAVGRPNVDFMRFAADNVFDNRKDYRRSSVGVSESLRGNLGVSPGDFVVVKRGDTGEQLDLVVQRLPQELLSDQAAGRPLRIATLSREAREILGIGETGERRERDKFRTVYEGVDFYPLRQVSKL